mgnify:CR=1 FL=1
MVLSDRGWPVFTAPGANFFASLRRGLLPVVLHMTLRLSSISSPQKRDQTEKYNENDFGLFAKFRFFKVENVLQTFFNFLFFCETRKIQIFSICLVPFFFLNLTDPAPTSESISVGS